MSQIWLSATKWADVLVSSLSNLRRDFGSVNLYKTDWIWEWWRIWPLIFFSKIFQKYIDHCCVVHYEIMFLNRMISLLISHVILINFDPFLFWMKCNFLRSVSKLQISEKQIVMKKIPLTISYPSSCQL